MTAEVAVINRLAVALAADSAVTLEKGGVAKIFQNANKIFELSYSKPIGVMFYNQAEFYGVPWEIIVKDFRTECGDSNLDTLFEWIPKFSSWLMNGRFRPSEEAQRQGVKDALAVAFTEAFREFLQRVAPILKGVSQPETQRVVDRFFQDVIDEEIAFLKKCETGGEMSLLDAATALEQYKAEFDEAIAEGFRDLELGDDERKKVAELAHHVLRTCRPGPNTTGLVFAGFGDKELFPSLQCVEFHNVVAGHLNQASKITRDIDRSNNIGDVIPFAQREAADSLLYGRSRKYDRLVASHFHHVIEEVGNALIDEMIEDEARRAELRGRVEQAATDAVDRFREHFSPGIASSIFADTLDIVQYMPKKELAEFAESLVNVTSIKRKASVGPETVGGPIDVAIISKHEGFVWVKRKHYFDPALNARYMGRIGGSK